MGGSGELILTGQQGSVMQESVRTALTWIRSHAAELGLTSAPAPAGGTADAGGAPGGDGVVVVSEARPGSSLLAGTDVHVHFPAGAIRKDGPSAGATTLVALVSLLTGRIARSDTAMSGEISLRGQILPVGGVREKVLAAHRAGLTRVLLPHQNRKDLHELSAKVRSDIDFIWCETVEDLLREALVDGPALASRLLLAKAADAPAAPDGAPEADAPTPPPRAPPALPPPLLTHSKL